MLYFSAHEKLLDAFDVARIPMWMTGSKMDFFYMRAYILHSGNRRHQLIAIHKTKSKWYLKEKITSFRCVFR